MKINEVSVSDTFKSQVAKTKYSIFLFVIVYLALFLLGIGLTIFSVYAGVKLATILLSSVTIILGMGLASLGFLILIFLIKFIFKSHKADYSHLTEIYRKDEPELFKILDELTYQIGTDFPKKVFLSPDVNAAVFYDSSFWSMFIPVKKNLKIGLGLVNTVSKEELKAILAHEFGHFSQKSMKSGSYVYHVNQVISNMLFDNESYDALIQRWASTSIYIEVFVILATRIIEGIQWVLMKVYKIVNKNYLALSREMEFHADEIAANVTGYEPLKNSLLRMDFAALSVNYVLSFYAEKFGNAVVSKNIYREQLFVMNLMAERRGVKIVNGFPSPSLLDLSKYNKSKLNIEDQWASHPNIKDRVEHLERTNLKSDQRDTEPANSIFLDIEKTQEKITQKFFSSFKSQTEPKVLSFDDFKNAFPETYVTDNFPKIYNGYYDDKNPVRFDTASVFSVSKKITIKDLFSDEKVGLVYTSIALQNDIDTLGLISKNGVKVKTFDYDGVKYKGKDSKKLQKKLKIELEQVHQRIKKNDLNIFSYFRRKEEERNRTGLAALYNDFFDYDSEFENKVQVYNDLMANLQFVQFRVEIAVIKRNFEENKVLEQKLKAHIRDLLKSKCEVTQSEKDEFELYLSREWEYFGRQQYLEENLNRLFKVLDSYYKILQSEYLNCKKRILDYQANLL